MLAGVALHKKIGLEIFASDWAYGSADYEALAVGVPSDGGSENLAELTVRRRDQIFFPQFSFFQFTISFFDGVHCDKTIFAPSMSTLIIL